MGCDSCSSENGCACASGAQGHPCSPCMGEPGRPVEQEVISARHPATTVAAIGQTWYGGLETIPLRDSRGWHAHVTRIRIIADAAFTTVAATMTGPLAGARLFSLIKASLKDDTGHVYFSSRDGRDFRNDEVARDYCLMAADPTDLADADATPSRTLIWDIVTGRLDSDGVTTDGMIPASILREKISLEVSTQAAVAGAPAGVTFNGFTGIVRVIPTVVYLPALVVGRAWVLRNYTVDEVNGKLDTAPAVHDYAVIRHYEEDTGGLPLTDYSAINLSVNGQTTYNITAAAELGMMNLARVDADPDSDAALVQAGADPVFGLIVPVQKEWTAGARGQIEYQVTRATHTTTRWLHRYSKCRTKDALACAAKAACLGPGPSMVAKLPNGQYVPPSQRPDAPIVMQRALDQPGVVIAHNDSLI